LVAELYGGPVLVLQGARDPLNDAPARAAALAAACSNVRVHLLEGGHCPHDEVPAAFNEALQGFMREVGVQRVAGAQEVAVVC
jgi:pimeloyl-ACP methyl ester carboxylesterase